MDINEKLFDAANQYARIAIFLLPSIFAVTIYLLQRTAKIYVGLLKPNSPNSQANLANLANLEFSYSTLSIIWPLVVSSLCFSFSQLVERFLQIWINLKDLQKSSRSAKDFELLFPFWLSIEAKTENSLIYVILTALSWTPLLVIFIHCVVVCYKSNGKYRLHLILSSVFVLLISFVFYSSFQQAFMRIMIR